MATRIIGVEERLETHTKDVEMWFEKFSCYLIDKELIIPTLVNPANITVPEQEAMDKMKKRRTSNQQYV